MSALATLSTVPPTVTKAALMCVVPISTPHSTSVAPGKPPLANRKQALYRLVSRQPAVHHIDKRFYHG